MTIYTFTVDVSRFAQLLYLTVVAHSEGEFNRMPRALYAGLAFVARFLPLRLITVGMLSTDTAVCVTVIVCHGTIAGAWTMFLSTYLKVV